MCCWTVGSCLEVKVCEILGSRQGRFGHLLLNSSAVASEARRGWSRSSSQLSETFFFKSTSRKIDLGT